MARFDDREQVEAAQLDAAEEAAVLLPGDMTFKAYGYMDEFGFVDVRTVSDTVRAAKVNALLVLFGFFVTKYDSEGQINEAFERFTKASKSRISELQIRPILDPIKEDDDNG